MMAGIRSIIKLQNPWLISLARAILLAYALLLVGLILAGTILFPDYASKNYTQYTPTDFWTVDQTQAALSELDWPASTVAWFEFVSNGITAIIGIGFALFLLWRKSADWFGMLLAFVFLGLGRSQMESIFKIFPGIVGNNNLFGTIGWQILFIIFYLFPDGRFVPRWTRWMPLVWLGVNLPSWLVGYDVLSTPPLGTWIGIGLVLSAIGSQVYRYGWRSTPLQRQQTKWVVAALVGLFTFLVFIASTIFKPPPEQALGETLRWVMLGGALLQLALLSLPVSIALAVLRYRLWDIDVVIRKTLVYGLLSGLLSLMYFGGVATLQAALGSVSGPPSPVVIVVTTLAIAALFNPLRRRVQDFIDRRFYRQKYDAEKALAEFATAARSETDLAQLSAHLTHTVRTALQPEQITLWLKDKPHVETK